MRGSVSSTRERPSVAPTATRSSAASQTPFSRNTNSASSKRPSKRLSQEKINFAPPPGYPIVKADDPLMEVTAVYQVLQERKWQEFDASKHKQDDWQLNWRWGRFKKSDYFQLKPYQRINHIPTTCSLTKKDSLVRLIRKSRSVHGRIYNFMPQSFILPSEYCKFVREYSKQQEDTDGSGGEKHVWIMKPADSSCGRKIFLMRELSELSYDEQYIIQRYIPKPHLIGGYKWDLRVYALVTQGHPLKVYVYEEGIVRFGTEKYDCSNLDNLYAHLTNTTINKTSPTLDRDKDSVGTGCTWTFGRLKSHFAASKQDDRDVWSKIVNIINLTVINLLSTVPKSTNCFELFGFDILVDQEFKPWLMEVNFSPALAVTSYEDEIKLSMVRDLLDVVFHKNGQKCRYPKVNDPDVKNEMLSAEDVDEVLTQPESVGKFHAVFPFNHQSEAYSMEASSNFGDDLGMQTAIKKMVRFFVIMSSSIFFQPFKLRRQINYFDFYIHMNTQVAECRALDQVIRSVTREERREKRRELFSTNRFLELVNRVDRQEVKIDAAARKRRVGSVAAPKPSIPRACRVSTSGTFAGSKTVSRQRSVPVPRVSTTISPTNSRICNNLIGTKRAAIARLNMDLQKSDFRSTSRF